MHDELPRARRTGTALVVVEPPAERPATRIVTARTDAGFLAHLLAIRAHAPSQRTKMRAAPETGAAAYRAGLGLSAPDPYHLVRTCA